MTEASAPARGEGWQVWVERGIHNVQSFTTSCGANWLALQTTRAAWQASLPRRHVVVRSLSGESVEMHVRRSAKVADVKDQVGRLWAINPKEQALSFENRILSDGELLATLDVGCQRHLTLCFIRRKSLTLERYEEILQEIHYERSRPAFADNERLRALLDERDRLHSNLIKAGFQEDDFGNIHR